MALLHRRDDPFLGTPVSQLPDQGPCVDPFDTDDAVIFHVLVQRLRSPPVTGDR